LPVENLLFRRGCFGLRFTFGSRLIDKFDVRHQSRVTLARAKLYDPAIAALPLRGSGRQFSKQFSYGLLLAKKRKRYPARVQVASLSEGDHPFRVRTYGFCRRQGRLDSVVFYEAANLIGEQQIPVLGFPA
jgi:hypothetical protein